MGIGGSGISGVAVFAKKLGFSVSGCDLESATPYLDKVKKANISVAKGHSEKHVDDCDILVISPAVLYQNVKHAEYQKAKKKKSVITWDEFVGQYLLNGKTTICVSGTHGKSTTTAWVSLLFELGGLDPNALVGATVKEWKTNFRYGKGNLFIIESDEFYEKFLNYQPQVILINNIEFDHPDYFKNEEEIIKSFRKFVCSLKGEKILVVNLDSEGVIKLLKTIPEKIFSSLKVYGYTLQQKAPYEIKNILYGNITERTPEYTLFSSYSKELGIDESFKIRIPGDYNVSNSLGVILLSEIFKIERSVLKQALWNFNGIGRRLELIGEKNGIKVYDDYGHHPTAIKATIKALRQKNPNKKIWAVVEPHSYSRTKALLDEYEGVFEDADEVIIGPIFKARDTKTFGVTGQSIVKASGHKKVIYKSNINGIISLLKKSVAKGDVIIIMGAGYSYQWSRTILKSI